MTTIGIIAEFNPFHNGHKYMIEKAKQITKANNVVVICSGNYVQRGVPAIIDKTRRAKMAISQGVDIVIELPVFYATASAELFATAAINLLDQLDCIDYLCFGCETDDVEKFSKIVHLLLDEPDEYQKLLHHHLKTGCSFPTARSKALSEYCIKKNLSNSYGIDTILLNPNNILAIEYLKALKKFHSNIKPIAIKRLGSNYHSIDMTKDFASAKAIRYHITNGQYERIKRHIPEICYQELYHSNYFNVSDFDLILGEKLNQTASFTDIFGINEDLSNRIEHLKASYTDFESFAALLCTKNHTHTAIMRALLHICLDLKEEVIGQFIKQGYHTYGRILGLNRNSKVLRLMKEHSRIDIVSKLSAYYKLSTGPTRQMLDICIRCDNLYRMVMMHRYGQELPTEFTTQVYVQ